MECSNLQMRDEDLIDFDGPLSPEVEKQIDEPATMRDDQGTVPNARHIGETKDLPDGFLRKTGAIIKTETVLEGRDKQPREVETFVCSDLRVLGQGATPDGEWGKLIAFRNPFGVERRIVVPFRHLAGDGKEARALLLSNGIVTANDRPGRAALATLLSFAGNDALYRLADGPGWHHDHFVLPSGVISPPTRDFEVAYDQSDAQHPFSSKGNLADWQKACNDVQGIPYAVVCLCAAFAGPVLQLLNAESGGIHIYGRSSRGKTSFARLASSVWGDPNRFVRSWHATVNGIEASAAESSDTLLVLDEVGQSDARGSASDIGKMIYMLANGVGKSRATKAGGSQQRATWRLISLSTGEHPIRDLVRDYSGTQRMSGGIGVRLLDLPIETDDFAMTEDAENPGETGKIIDAVRDSICHHHGHAGQAFVQRIVEDRDSAKDFLDQKIADVMKIFSLEQSDPQLQRSAKRFALMIAAGALAEHYKILAWREGTSQDAGYQAYLAWKTARGGNASLEEQNAVDAVRLFLEVHGEARFRELADVLTDDHDPVVADQRAVAQRAGFRGTDKEGNAIWYILPEVWRAEVCRGLDARFVARVLKARGILMAADGQHLAKKIRLPNMPETTRFYTVTAKILEAS